MVLKVCISYKQGRKCTNSVTILSFSREFDLLSLWTVPMSSDLSGWLGIPQVTMATKVIIVRKIAMLIKVTWEFPTQLPARKGHVGLHVKCTLLLSDCKQNWNMSTDVSKTPQCQISWICQPFSRCYTQADGWTSWQDQVYCCTFATFGCKRIQKALRTCNSNLNIIMF
jgi:hypothetical protein